MNSLAFVRDARALLTRMISTSALPEGDTREMRRKQHQQDLDFLFNNLVNPSLPSAYKLLMTAHRQRYTVDSRAHQRINRFA